MKRVEDVYKSSDLKGSSAASAGVPTENVVDIDPNRILFDAVKGFQKGIFSNFGDIKKDFSDVSVAVKNFPLRSFLTVIGVIFVVYITFNLVRKFGILS